MTELLVALGIGTLGAAGLHLLLRARSFDVILGLALLSHAVNLFIFAMGRLTVNAAPVLTPGRPADLAHHADPLPQALVLTAIVISFGMTALAGVLALVSHRGTDDDHVDAQSADADARTPGDAP